MRGHTHAWLPLHDFGSGGELGAKEMYGFEFCGKCGTLRLRPDAVKMLLYKLELRRRVFNPPVPETKSMPHHIGRGGSHR